MTKIHRFSGTTLIVGALTLTSVVAQSPQPSSQGSSTSTSREQTSGQSGGAQAQPARDREMRTSSGEKVGEDVPTQGTQTDQRGRTAATSGAGAATLSGVDRTFLTDALEGNKAEAELAELAGRKATGAAVREYAQMLQKDHTAANARLTRIASDAGAADNEPSLKSEHAQLKQRLSKLEGAAFDRAYMAAMVTDHQKDVQHYEKATAQLQHAGLKAYATETLPKLKQHLEKARKLAATPGTH
jgi:putative membrane protein